MSGPPGAISNGPSRIGTLDKDAQIWERPWTLEEMQQSGASWSLAADTGVSQTPSSQILVIVDLGSAFFTPAVLRL